ncbi:MAG: hypothetical protein JO163_08045 [Methylobacteriaceae bacterium]|nr:hypothetical protein [Methylobacteriaceae bacterium]
MRLRGQAVADRPWLIAALVLAGFVHIASVLAMPRLAQDDAFARLASAGPLNEFHALPRPEPGAELVPFNDPAFSAGVCLFDLSEGPLHVRARLISDSFVSLSFHSRHGTVFYALTDKATTRRAFDLFVATADQLAAMEAKDTEEEPPQELRVLASGKKGFVLARALAPQPSAYEDAAAQIAEMNCSIEPLEGR